jgi:hypothetical protein
LSEVWDIQAVLDPPTGPLEVDHKLGIGMLQLTEVSDLGITACSTKSLSLGTHALDQAVRCPS